jgi:hypothetical protein
MLHEGCDSQISEKEKSHTITKHTHTHTHYFLSTHKMGQIFYKNTHMINDLGITNDGSKILVIVRVREKRWGQRNIDDLGPMGIITSF